MRSLLVLLIPLASNAVCVAGEPLEDWRQCLQIGNDADRLACYDRMASSSGPQQVDVALAGQQSAPADVSEATEAQPTGTASVDTGSSTADDLPPAVEDFGKDEGMLRAERERERGSVREIHATVESIVQNRYGKRTFTLDNGQVWVERFESRSLKLEPGDQVRIKSGALGSYRLFGSGKVSSKVQRVR